MEESVNLSELIEFVLQGQPTCSDILIAGHQPPMVKTPDGWVMAVLPESFNSESVNSFMSVIEPDWESLLRLGSINRPLNLGRWRLRVHAYLAFGGLSIMLAIRVIRTEPLTIQQAGLPASTRMLIEAGGGVILVSGATGSGKTSTLAAIINVINETRAHHIVTIEDPIEFIFEQKKSVFSQREVGVDCASFSAGIEDAMRERPDVIVIGEIRDRATAEQCLLASESGHLVIATIHANSAVGTVSKMQGFFADNERQSKLQSLQINLIGIIHQTLLPSLTSPGESVMAVDFMANHRRQFSRVLNEPEKMQALMDNKEDGISVGLGESLLKLLSDGKISKGDAARVALSNSAVYKRICP